jgi:hypothetical protein
VDEMYSSFTVSKSGDTLIIIIFGEPTTFNGGNQTTYSLNGVWERADGNVISIIDSYGYFTLIDSGWKKVEDNGDIKIGSAKFRNINSTGNLTWSAQELSYDPSTYHVRSWDNCTITMASNGNTFTTSNDPSIIYTRRR